MGAKVREVAEKVATDTAEDLKKAAGAFEGDIPGMTHYRETQHSTCTHLDRPQECTAVFDRAIVNDGSCRTAAYMYMPQ